MPVHALQGRERDLLLRSGNAKLERPGFANHAGLLKMFGKSMLLASLSEPANVNLNQLRQIRNPKIPFVRQPVAPTLGLHLGMQFIAQCSDRRLLTRRR